jgi:hypothetical protein
MGRSSSLPDERGRAAAEARNSGRESASFLTYRSSSQSIRSSAKVRVFGFPQNSPIRSARSKSGSMRTWNSSRWA